MDRPSKIHVAYILGILLAVIVILVTVKWHGIGDLVGYFSFALTLASLILAVLATAYAIYSNASLASVLGQLTASSGSLALTSGKLEASTSELSAKVAGIPGSLEGISQEVREINVLLKDLSEKSMAPVENTDPSATQKTDRPIAERVLAHAPVF
jgi:hypothetical protein